MERDLNNKLVEIAKSISTHTLTWSVTGNLNIAYDISLISTHTLTWSVTTLLSAHNKSVEFQLTRSRGAWRTETYYRRIYWNFNSHAHVERDLCESTSAESLRISTHTLTWSVTLQCYPQTACLKFQLTRSRGAWLHARFFHLCGWDFNSHAHVERDDRKRTYFPLNKISTHTLTWSVTVLN